MFVVSIEIFNENFSRIAVVIDLLCPVL